MYLEHTILHTVVGGVDATVSVSAQTVWPIISIVKGNHHMPLGIALNFRQKCAKLHLPNDNKICIRCAARYSSTSPTRTLIPLLVRLPPTPPPLWRERTPLAALELFFLLPYESSLPNHSINPQLQKTCPPLPPPPCPSSCARCSRRPRLVRFFRRHGTSSTSTPRTPWAPLSTYIRPALHSHLPATTI